MPDRKTLRDEFAMMALAGDFASPVGVFDDEDTEHLKERARLYYRMADVMMVERMVDRGRVHPFRRETDHPL